MLIIEKFARFCFDLKIGTLKKKFLPSGKRSCLFSVMKLLLYRDKTLGSIDYWYSKLVENKSAKSPMKDFINCINPRILYLDQHLD